MTSLCCMRPSQIGPVSGTGLILTWNRHHHIRWEPNTHIFLILSTRRSPAYVLNWQLNRRIVIETSSSDLTDWFGTPGVDSLCETMQVVHLCLDPVSSLTWVVMLMEFSHYSESYWLCCVPVCLYVELLSYTIIHTVYIVYYWSWKCLILIF